MRLGDPAHGKVAKSQQGLFQIYMKSSLLTPLHATSWVLGVSIFVQALRLSHSGVNICTCICVCIKMLTLCLWGCCVNAENGYRTRSLHLYLHQLVYGNTILQFDTNTNVEASVNETLVIVNWVPRCQDPFHDSETFFCKLTLITCDTKVSISAATDESIDVDVDASGSVVTWWTLTGYPGCYKTYKGMHVHFVIQ